MAGALLSRRGGRSGAFRRRRYEPMSEINVTPFVDVMLVLLIVFMVTAPLLTVGVPVDLPQAKARALAEPIEPLIVTMKADGKLFIQETEVEQEAMIPRLVAITEANPEARIYIRGDKRLPYGEIMSIMGRINAAGFNRVALITEMPKSDE